jgi:tetratricopeptide (TPR) repeat protein
MGLFSNNNTDELYEEALGLARIDDEECIRCYDKILEIDSNENMAWRGKGLALGRLERSQEAIICFNKALGIDPDDDIAQRSKDIELEALADLETSSEYRDDVKNNVVTNVKEKNKLELEFIELKKESIESTKILMNEFESSDARRALKDNKVATAIYDGFIFYMQKNMESLERDIVAIQNNINFNKVMINNLEDL